MHNDKIKMMAPQTEKADKINDSASLVCSTQDFEELKDLCKQLLDGADKCSQLPHYIVQPFLGIVKRNMCIIQKHGLM